MERNKHNIRQDAVISHKNLQQVQIYRYLARPIIFKHIPTHINNSLFLSKLQDLILDFEV